MRIAVQRSVDPEAAVSSNLISESPRIAVIVEDGVLSPASFADAGSITTSGFVDSPPSEWQSVCGRIGGIPVLVMTGPSAVSMNRTLDSPVLVAQSADINTLLVVGWAIPLAPEYNPGDVVAITDHVNLLGDSPLIRSGERPPGSRFPDMSKVYDSLLITSCVEAGRAFGEAPHLGVFVSCSREMLGSQVGLNRVKSTGAHAAGPGIVPHTIMAACTSMHVLALVFLVEYRAAEASLRHPSGDARPGAVRRSLPRLIGRWVAEISARECPASPGFTGLTET